MIHHTGTAAIDLGFHGPWWRWPRFILRRMYNRIRPWHYRPMSEEQFRKMLIKGNPSAYPPDHPWRQKK
jgi:hypothetical protein